MKNTVMAIVKFVIAAALWLVTFLLIENHELMPFVGTLVLIAIATLSLSYVNDKCVKLVSSIFLLFIVIVSHGVDRYFWCGVWKHGYPWPFDLSSQGRGALVGSITPYIYQVSIVSFSVLLVAGVVIAVMHLRRRLRQDRNTATRYSTTP